MSFRAKAKNLKLVIYEQTDSSVTAFPLNDKYIHCTMSFRVICHSEHGEESLISPIKNDNVIHSNMSFRVKAKNLYSNKFQSNRFFSRYVSSEIEDSTKSMTSAFIAHCQSEHGVIQSGSEESFLK